jgi:hypothetical protein
MVLSRPVRRHLRGYRVDAGPALGPRPAHGKGIERAATMPERETVEVELSPEDRSLILRYGYPFERIERALKALEGRMTGESVALDRFELERLIGDLSYSTNHADDENLQLKLNDLCVRLEFFARGDYTVM